MCYDFRIKEENKIRLIIGTDAKNEADDQFALVHALLSPTFNIKGIIANHFEKKQKVNSMIDSYHEIKKVLNIMKRDDIPVLMGSEKSLNDDRQCPLSEGADFIITEALKEGESPLYVLMIGSLTDIAIAYLNKPEIAEKLTVIWVGGGAYPNGGSEFNIMNDIYAANIVFKSKLPLWHLPASVCASIRASFAELQCKVKPYGEIGRYLFEELMSVYSREEWPKNETWTLWDSAGIGVLLDDQSYSYKSIIAPSISSDMAYIHDGLNREIRVYENVNDRFILEDFYSKLFINYK